MKKKVLYSAVVLLSLVLLGGLGAAFIFLRPQERGGDHLAPNAPEAVKFVAAASGNAEAAEKAPDYQLPTEFKLPNDLQIETPQVPEGVSSVAGGNSSVR